MCVCSWCSDSVVLHCSTTLRDGMRGHAYEHDLDGSASSTIGCLHVAQPIVLLSYNYVNM